MINSVHLYSIYKVETHDFNFYLNRIFKIFFIRQPEIIYGQKIRSFTFFLIHGCTHCLRFFLSLICSWLSINSPPPAIINNSTSLLLSMSVRHFLKNNRAFYINLDFRFEKRLFLKYFKNDFKIFWKYFLIAIVLYIFRISLCVTSP